MDESIKPVGQLNRIYGYKGFHPIEPGTPVYKDHDGYFFYMTAISDGSIHTQRFSFKSGITEHISFYFKIKSI